MNANSNFGNRRPYLARIALAAALILLGGAVTQSADAAKKKKAVSAVAPNDFVLSTAATVALGKGKTKLVTIAVRRGKGFKAPLSLRVENPLAGVVAEVTKATTKSITVELGADTTVTPQTGVVQVIADGNGISKAAAITVNVDGGGAPAAAPAPAPAPAATPATAAPAPASAAPASTAPVSAPAPALTAAPVATTAPVPFKLRVDAFPSLVVPGGSIVVSAAIDVAPGAKAPQVTIKPTNLPKGVTISPSQLTTDSVGTFRVTLPPSTNLGSTGFFFEGVAGALKSRSTGPAMVDVVAAPLISVVQNLELVLNQAETFGLLLSSPFVGGLSNMKYETATVIPGATITFGARRSDGFVLMTVATTQQTPPGTYPVDVVASDAFVPGSTTLTAQVVVKSNGVNDGFTLDAKLNGVSFDNVPVYGLSGATKPAQVVPGVTATVTVKVGGVNGQPTPPVRLEFASTADYQVTPETITTDNSATFSVKFLRASDSAIYIRLKGISGGKQQPANYPVLVSNKPIISYGNGCPLETNPSASSVTILVKVHKVTGMGPVTINVGRGGTSALMDWAITKRYPDGSADVTFTYLRQFLPSGGYELFDLVASAGNGSEFSTSRRVRISHNPELTACTT